MLAAKVLIVALLVILAVGELEQVLAEPKCESELQEARVQTYNLDESRDALERKLAAEQVRTYRLKKEVEALKQQLAEAKKPADEKKAE